jgi:hypothetical protein
VVELAQVRSPGDLARVDQAYADLRELFGRFALAGAVLPKLDGGCRRSRFRSLVSGPGSQLRGETSRRQRNGTPRWRR